LSIFVYFANCNILVLCPIREKRIREKRDQSRDHATKYADLFRTDIRIYIPPVNILSPESFVVLDILLTYSTSPSLGFLPFSTSRKIYGLLSIIIITMFARFQPWQEGIRNLLLLRPRIPSNYIRIEWKCVRFSLSLSLSPPLSPFPFNTSLSLFPFNTHRGY